MDKSYQHDHSVQHDHPQHDPLEAPRSEAPSPAQRHASWASAGVTGEALLQQMSGSSAPVQCKIMVGAQEAAFDHLEGDHRHHLDPALANRRVEREGKTVTEMSNDPSTRYFADEGELHNYAMGDTNNIGYVDREKTWVRLPNRPLLLGERHNGTTAPDLANATGARYLYEANTPESPYLQGNDQSPAGINSSDPNAIEAQLPKLIIGLNAFKARVAKYVANDQDALGINGGPGQKSKTKKRWKDDIKHFKKLDIEEFKPEKRDEEKTEYNEQLNTWSEEWDQNHPTAKSRNEDRSAPDGEMTLSPLREEAPYRTYDFNGVAQLMALQAFRILQKTKRPKPFSRSPKAKLYKFYKTHENIIDETVTELEAGVAPEHTTVFKKMVTGRFNMDALIQHMLAAAQQEAQNANVPQIDADTLGYEGNHEEGDPNREANLLRDSYMLQSIREGVANGVQLFGVGDAHRQNIQGVLQDENIESKPSGQFYAEQHQDHPDV